MGKNPLRACSAIVLLALFLGITPIVPAQTAPAPKKNQLHSAAADWAPPDIDAAVPPVASGTECDLPPLIKKTSARLQELVANFPKFAAAEHVEHFEAMGDGKWKAERPVVFDYQVETQEARKGMLIVDEMRGDRDDLKKFPAGLATLGLPALALVFHPYFLDDYNFKCEGLGNFDGYYTWLVRFQQRPDKLPRSRSYRIKQRSFLLGLKGRAWISTQNFQLLHMETDLVEPVPRIQLLREHLSVDYGAVNFRRADEELWLPQRAEVFMDYRGHRYHRVHTFSDFKLFTVDTEQKVKAPSEQ